MRKLILGLAATIGVLATLGLSAPANAYTANADGSLKVTKGEVQSALGWNNADFDYNVPNSKAKDVTFTADAEVLAVKYPMTCLKSGDIGYRNIYWNATTALAATQTLSGNGKQINGWTLSGKGAEGITAINGGRVQDTGCAEGDFLFRNAGTPIQPMTVTITGNVKVNGAPLSLVVPAPVV